MTVTPIRESRTEGYPFVRWDTHFSNLDFKQGQHVLIAGPTGSGKTTMARRLVEKRSHAVVMVSKITDDTISKEFKGFTILERWPNGGPKPWQNRILLWPRQQRTLGDTVMVMREVFGEALDAIAREGNRCVVIDESLMFNDPKFIGKAAEVSLMHYYGRSAGISMIDLTQRPAWIPTVIYSSVTHAYIARTRDRNDLKRLADMGGIDPKTVAVNVSALPSRHEYVYLNPQGDASPHIVNTKK